MSCVTYLYEIRPDGSQREISMIHGNSLFFGFRVPKEIKKTQYAAKSQMWIAVKLRNGWIANGQMNSRSLTISQKQIIKGHAEWTHKMERKIA